MTILTYVQSNWQGMATGGGLVYAVSTIAKWIPTWPLSWEKLYNWFRNSTQDIASHLQGSPGQKEEGPENPTPPV
jgi:hypothetical protein